ncbi:MAG: ImmA/IrrE family metallo-endopeptidase [Stenomitos rutilans HA7619-LM2]|nr:ImmA/IrrE family metallo-endopeptidase [Stenomitos rutilans HA7619-LM2]
MSEVDPPQPYRNPGRDFLLQNGLLRTEKDIYRYVEFLRQQSGLSDAPPIDLSRIYRCFGIPTPRRAPLEEQQGILLDSETGKILIKEDDPIGRQRFTEGHELLELLFAAQDSLGGVNSIPVSMEREKERLCDRGSAELLMPTSSFRPMLNDLGISFSTGQTLATLYQTSLLATLLQMLRLEQGDCALVVWHFAFKPSEVKNSGHSEAFLQKKPRVLWSMSTETWTGGYIPKSKSVSFDSLLFQTYDIGHPHSGAEIINLGQRSISCLVEAMRVQMGDDNCVMSLLHMLHE